MRNFTRTFFGTVLLLFLASQAIAENMINLYGDCGHYSEAGINKGLTYWRIKIENNTSHPIKFYVDGSEDGKMYFTKNINDVSGDGDTELKISGNWEGYLVWRIYHPHHNDIYIFNFGSVNSTYGGSPYTSKIGEARLGYTPDNWTHYFDADGNKVIGRIPFPKDGVNITDKQELAVYGWVNEENSYSDITVEVNKSYEPTHSY